MPVPFRALHPLLSPRSIAVVGASADRSKLGNVIFRNCRSFGYRGRVFPVNPHAETIEGERAYPNLAQLPIRPDCIIVATPAEVVPQIITDAAKQHIPSAIVISAGFRETGKSGSALEERITRIAISADMALLGPNCLGVIVPHLGLNASFAAGMPSAGSVSILSQSGAMAVALADWASESGLAFRHLVSLGNKAVIDETDFLRYFGADSGTRVVMMYLEDVRNGIEFLHVASRLSRKLPIVVIKAGKTEAAAAAVASHTGALVSSGEATIAALRSAGCVVVDTIEEWFDVARAFAALKVPAGDRIAIVTNAGGPGILATDAVGKERLTMAHFSSATLRILARALPHAAALHNPVDVVGDAPPERYHSALTAVAKDPGTDAIVAVMTHQLITNSEGMAQAIIDTAKSTSKPVFASLVGGEGVRGAVRMLREAGVPSFHYPESAVRALWLVRSWLQTKPNSPPIIPKPHHPIHSRNPVISGEEALNILRKYGMASPPGLTVRSAPAAVQAAIKLGFPVVMKIISSAVVHKTDARGVVMDVHSEKAAAEVARSFLKSFGKKLRGPHEGILVQPHIQDALEVFVGAVRVPDFGPMVLLGLGGIFVESLHAVTYSPAPLSPAQAKVFIAQSPLWPIIKGTRGKVFALADLEKALCGLSRFIAVHPEVHSVDGNPLMLTRAHAWLVDARIILDS